MVRSVCTALVALVCWVICVNHGAAQPATKLVRVTYPIADLVSRNAAAQAEALTLLITKSIAPTTWEAAGGAGTIQYFPMGRALVICQAQAEQERIQMLLRDVRRMQSALQRAMAAQPVEGQKLPPRRGASEEQSIPEPRTAAGPSATERAIEHRLRLPLSVHFKQVPLDQATKDLTLLSGVNIVVDSAALKKEGIAQDAPISIRVEEVDMKSVLKILLKQPGLTYVIENDAIRITTPAMETGRLLRKTYAVGDLVDCMTLVDHTGRGKESAIDSLKAIVQTTISRKSWESQGGAGSIQYLPQQRHLVIHQATWVHDQVDLLLASLRRLYDTSVEIELRVVHASPATAKQWRKSLGQRGKDDADAPMSASRAQLGKLLETAQADSTATISQMPRVTALNGQRCVVDVGMDEHGWNFEVNPVVAPDRRSVRVGVAMEHRSTDKARAIQNVIRANRTASVADGQTLIWDLGPSAGRRHTFVLLTSRLHDREESERIFLGELEPIPGR